MLSSCCLCPVLTKVAIKESAIEKIIEEQRNNHSLDLKRNFAWSQNREVGKKHIYSIYIYINKSPKTKTVCFKYESKGTTIIPQSFAGSP